jgi:DNA helicase-2/ATP-dependent DNA helicase PcrA
VGRLAAWAEERNLPLYNAVERAGEILNASERPAKAVRSFWAQIREQGKHLRRGGDLAASTGDLIQAFGFREEILEGNQSGGASEKRLADLDGFLDGMREYTEKASKPTLREFLHQISLNELEDDTEDDASKRVTLCTLHGAKGLEFELVFLVGMEEGLLPHDRVVNPHQHDAHGGDVDEERRLCYVGITRARDKLVLTRAARRLVAGKMKDRAPSRFICDLPEGLLEEDDRTRVLDADEARLRLAAIKAKLG